MERELIFREAAGSNPDSPSKEEIVDEAIARALGDGENKPDRLGLEPWLYRLAMQAMNDLSSQEYEALRFPWRNPRGSKMFAPAMNTSCSSTSPMKR